MMSLKDKGNAWKLVYAALVLTENAPKMEEGYIEDEEENFQDITASCNAKDIVLNIKDKDNEDIQYWEINLSEALNAFVDDYEKGNIAPPFKYESYIHNDDIIDTLKLMT